MISTPVCGDRSANLIPAQCGEQRMQSEPMPLKASNHCVNRRSAQPGRPLPVAFSEDRGPRGPTGTIMQSTAPAQSGWGAARTAADHEFRRAAMPRNAVSAGSSSTATLRWPAPLRSRETAIFARNLLLAPDCQGAQLAPRR